MSLEKRTVSSLRWTLLERVGAQAITFVVQILLARILLPEEFGIVATVTIILLLARAITDGGMGSALIQNQIIERKDVSTVFFMNIALSLLIFAGLTVAAQSIADYFGEPILRFVLPVLALGIVISSVGQTQMSMLIKNQEFERLLQISLPATICSGAAGILMALTGFGVWALVGQRVSQDVIQTSLLWKFCNREWRPRLEFSLASFKKLAEFSLAKLLATLFQRVGSNVHGLVIAKAFSIPDLAFYNRGNSFQKQPVTMLVGSLNRIMFPMFSEIQHDDVRMRSALRKGIPPLTYLVIPAMFWLITVADPLIRVLLTAKWIESVPYLRVAPLLGICYCIAVVKMNVINGKGLSRLVLIIGIVRPAVKLITLWLTWRHGIMAILVGQVCVSFINMLLVDFCVARVINFPMRRQIWDWLPYLGIALIACGTSSLLNLSGISVPIVLLFLQTLVFGAIYLGLCWIFPLTGQDFFSKRVNEFRKKHYSKVASGHTTRV